MSNDKAQMTNQKAKGKRQKAKGKRQKAKGKRQKAKGKRQKAKGKRLLLTAAGKYWGEKGRFTSAISLRSPRPLRFIFCF
jgi:uncharacterized protein YjbJ (UPF0337 family)